MTPAQFRKIALSFPGASESARHGHPDFRVAGKIFATMGCPDESTAVVLLTPEEQAAYIKLAPEAFAPVAGAWGLKGSTAIHLSAAKTRIVRASMKAAWRRRAPRALSTAD
jgi:hypothetical protein